MYLLDTCVLSDFVKGQKNTQDKLKSLPPSAIALSSLTLMEIEYGLQRIPQRRQEIDEVMNSFYQVVEIIPFCNKCAFKAADLRFTLTQQGKPIGPYDYLIAATAITHNRIIVTSNLKEFERIDGLKIENWR